MKLKDTLNCIGFLNDVILLTSWIPFSIAKSIHITKMYTNLHLLGSELGPIIYIITMC